MPTLNQSKVVPENNVNMRRSMTPGEVADLDTAIAADGQELLDFLNSLHENAKKALTAKRAEILTQRDPAARKVLHGEARALIFKKVGAQAFLKAME